MSTALTDQVLDPTPGRRGLGGRLYHGETAIDFYGRRWWGLGLSLLLLLITVASLFTRGLNLGIDFEGGVAWEVPTKALSADQTRQILDDNGITGSSAKVQQRTSASGDSLLVQVGAQSVEVRQQGTSKFTIQFIGRDGKLLATSTSNLATYSLRGNEPYVRAKVIESNGKMGWTQPLFRKR